MAFIDLGTYPIEWDDDGNASIPLPPEMAELVGEYEVEVTIQPPPFSDN